MEFFTLFLTIYLTIGLLIGFIIIKSVEKFATDYENGEEISEEVELLLREMSLIYKAKGEKQAVLLILLTTACFWMFSIFKKKN